MLGLYMYVGLGADVAMWVCVAVCVLIIRECMNRDNEEVSNEVISNAS